MNTSHSTHREAEQATIRPLYACSMALDSAAAKAAFDVNETSRILSIGRTTLYSLVKSGKLRATKLGRKTLFLSDDIQDFLYSLRTEGVSR